jgi:hypothetical protein
VYGCRRTHPLYPAVPRRTASCLGRALTRTTVCCPPAARPLSRTVRWLHRLDSSRVVRYATCLGGYVRAALAEQAGDRVLGAVL